MSHDTHACKRARAGKIVVRQMQSDISRIMSESEAHRGVAFEKGIHLTCQGKSERVKHYRVLRIKY